MALRRNLKFLRSQFFLTHPVHNNILHIMDVEWPSFHKQSMNMNNEHFTDAIIANIKAGH